MPFINIGCSVGRNKPLGSTHRQALRHLESRALSGCHKSELDHRPNQRSHGCTRPRGPETGAGRNVRIEVSEANKQMPVPFDGAGDGSSLL